MQHCFGLMQALGEALTGPILQAEHSLELQMAYLAHVMRHVPIHLLPPRQELGSREPCSDARS